MWCCLCNPFSSRAARQAFGPTPGGIRAFWSGLTPFMPRVMALVSVQLSTYDQVFPSGNIHVSCAFLFCLFLRLVPLGSPYPRPRTLSDRLNCFLLRCAVYFYGEVQMHIFLNNVCSEMQGPYLHCASSMVGTLLGCLACHPFDLVCGQQLRTHCLPQAAFYHCLDCVCLNTNICLSNSMLSADCCTNDEPASSGWQATFLQVTSCSCSSASLPYSLLMLLLSSAPPLVAYVLWFTVKAPWPFTRHVFASPELDGATSVAPANPFMRVPGV